MDNSKRVFLIDGEDCELSQPHLTDTQIAKRVAMLIKSDVNYGAVIQAAGERILCLQAERDFLIHELEQIRDHGQSSDLDHYDFRTNAVEAAGNAIQTEEIGITGPYFGWEPDAIV